MKHIHHALAGSAVAETVVVGTGNPDIDIPAVQAAVDQGGDVVLRGSHWGVSARESVN